MLAAKAVSQSATIDLRIQQAQTGSHPREEHPDQENLPKNNLPREKELEYLGSSNYDTKESDLPRKSNQKKHKFTPNE